MKWLLRLFGKWKSTPLWWEKTDGLFNVTEIGAYNRQLLSIRDFQEGEC